MTQLTALKGDLPNRQIPQGELVLRAAIRNYIAQGGTWAGAQRILSDLHTIAESKGAAGTMPSDRKPKVIGLDRVNVGAEAGADQLVDGLLERDARERLEVVAAQPVAVDGQHLPAERHDVRQ